MHFVSVTRKGKSRVRHLQRQGIDWIFVSFKKKDGTTDTHASINRHKEEFFANPERTSSTHKRIGNKKQKNQAEDSIKGKKESSLTSFSWQLSSNGPRRKT